MVKREADSSDVTDIPHHVKPSTGMFICLECIWGESWKYFMGQKNGLHAFGYNSADSEPIWIKFGTLWAICLGLALADFGRDSCSSDSLRRSRNLFFCAVNNARFYDSRLVLPCKFEQNFENFTPRMGPGYPLSAFAPPLSIYFLIFCSITFSIFPFLIHFIYFLLPEQSHSVSKREVVGGDRTWV